MASETRLQHSASIGRPGSIIYYASFQEKVQPGHGLNHGSLLDSWQLWSTLSGFSDLMESPHGDMV